jgi:hypothetical protein
LPAAVAAVDAIAAADAVEGVEMPDGLRPSPFAERVLRGVR